MQSDYIGQIHKGNMYSNEPWRIQWVGGDNYEFEGLHHLHHINGDEGVATCTCNFFQMAKGIYDSCAHIIAFSRILRTKPILEHP